MRPSRSRVTPPHGAGLWDGTLESVVTVFFRSVVRVIRALFLLLLLLHFFVFLCSCALAEDGIRLDIAGNIYLDFAGHSTNDADLANELIRKARRFAEEKKV